jgi:hypothetical protein
MTRKSDALNPITTASDLHVGLSTQQVLLNSSNLKCPAPKPILGSSPLSSSLMFLSLAVGVSLAASAWASIIGVEVAVQQLFNSPGTNYPTTFTCDVVPVCPQSGLADRKKSIHSHNDYWRDVPLYSALSYGVISVEADVWLVNGTLYIGHDVQSLTPNRTFDGLYIQPLVEILTNANPDTPFTEQAGTQPYSYSLPRRLIVEVYSIETGHRRCIYS